MAKRIEEEIMREQIANDAEAQIISEKLESENETVKETENNQVPADEEPKGKPTSRLGKIVKSRYVRIRKGPSTSSSVIATLEAGDTVMILDRVEGYYKVQVPSTLAIGYIASTYLKEV